MIGFRQKSSRVKITIIKGDGWRKYVDKMPNKQLRPIGTAKAGKLEGALVLDLGANVYMLIEHGTWHDLDQAKVRAALAIQ